MPNVVSKYASLLVCAALVLAAASFGARYMPGPWYQALVKPAWTPPGWLFGPVWSILYIMIAIAGWRAWRASGLSAAVIVWGINILANGLWSYLMFGQQQIGLAFADIALVWLTIIGFIALAWPIDRIAALLFVPYLIWVSYASALNFAIWQLNP